MSAPVSLTSVSASGATNAGTLVTGVTKLSTPTLFALRASTLAGTRVSPTVGIARFALSSVASSAQIALSWNPQLVFANSVPTYDVYVATVVQMAADNGSIDLAASRVATNINATSYTIRQLGSGALLTNGQTYVVKVVGKNDLNRDGVVEYAVSELLRATPLPLPDIRTLSAYFFSPLSDNFMAVVVATPTTVALDTYTLYATDRRIDENTCKLYRPPTVDNCAGIALASQVYTSPGSFDVGVDFASKFFTLNAVNDFAVSNNLAVQSRSVELQKMPLQVTSSATQGAARLQWPAVFGTSTTEEYTIYYATSRAAIDTSNSVTGIVGDAAAPTNHNYIVGNLTVGATYYFKVVAKQSGIVTGDVYLRSNPVPFFATSVPTPSVINRIGIVQPFTQSSIFTDVNWDLRYAASDGNAKYRLLCSENTRHPIDLARNPLAVQCNYVNDFVNNTSSCSTSFSSIDITPSALSPLNDTGSTRVEVPFGKWRYCSIVSYDNLPSPAYTVVSNEASVLAPVKKPTVVDVDYSDAPANSAVRGQWTIESTPAIASYMVYYYAKPSSDVNCSIDGAAPSAGCQLIGSKSLSANTGSANPGLFTHPATSTDMFYTIFATSSSNIPVYSDEKVLLSIEPKAVAGPTSVVINWEEHTPSLSPNSALCIKNVPLAPPLDCDSLYNNRASRCDSVIDSFASGNSVSAPHITIGATHYFYLLSTSSQSTGYTCGVELNARAGVPEKPNITTKVAGYYINTIGWDAITNPPASQAGTIFYTLRRSTQQRSECDYLVRTDCSGFMSYPATTVLSVLDDVRSTATPYVAPADIYYTLIATNTIGQAISDEALIRTITVAASVNVRAISSTRGEITVTGPSTNSFQVFRIAESETNPTGCISFVVASCDATSVITSLTPGVATAFDVHPGNTYVYVQVTSPRNEVVFLGPYLVSYEAQLSSIAVGVDSACVITVANKHVLCWGVNDQGQLGNGQTTANFTTTGVRVIDSADQPLSDVVAVGIGWKFACALQSDGDVYCWGENKYAETGSGGTSSARFTKAIQVNASGRALAAGISVKQIAVGRKSVCTLTTTNQIWCWGSNSIGQIGGNVGATPNLNQLEAVALQMDFDLEPGVQFVPDSISMSNDTTNLDGASVKTCASGTITLSDGTSSRGVFCWGANASEHGGASGVGGAVSVASLVKGLTGTLPANSNISTIGNNDIPSQIAGWPAFIPSNLVTVAHDTAGNFATPGHVATASGYSCAIVTGNTQTAIRTWGNLAVNNSFLYDGATVFSYAGSFASNTGDSVKCWGKNGDIRNVHLYRLGRTRGDNPLGAVNNAINLVTTVSASAAFAVVKLPHATAYGSPQTFTITQPVTRSYPLAIPCGFTSLPPSPRNYQDNINTRDGLTRCTVSGIGPQANIGRKYVATVKTSLTGGRDQQVYEPRREVFSGFSPIKLTLGYAHSCVLLATSGDQQIRRAACWGDNQNRQISYLLDAANLATLTNRYPESRSIVTTINHSGATWLGVLAPYLLRHDTSSNQGDVYNIVDVAAGSNDTCVIITDSANAYCIGELYRANVNPTSPATILFNSNLF